MAFVRENGCWWELNDQCVEARSTISEAFDGDRTPIMLLY